jgi:peptide/nickel transport system substrate-binding protein
VEAKSSAGLDARTPQFLLGTGPFKFKDAVSGSSIALVKNPDYFRKGVPYLDAISMYVITDTRGQIDAMGAKRVDMVNPLGFSIPSQQDYENYLSSVKGAVFNMRETQVGNIIWVNTTHKPFDDVRVRQALALTFDRPAIYTAVYGDPRWNGTTAGFFTSFYGLSPAEVAKTVGWDLPYDQRVAKAKSLLTAAGYPNGGFKLNMVSISSMAVFAKQFELLADVWKRQLNIDTQLTPYVLADALMARNSGNYDLFVYASLSLMGDPDELMPLFKGGSSANYTGYKNPAVDALWTQQSSEMDLNKRVQQTRQIETALLTDFPAIPACFSNYGVAWWPYVKGFVIQSSSYTSNLAFETVWLDK